MRCRGLFRSKRFRPWNAPPAITGCRPHFYSARSAVNEWPKKKDPSIEGARLWGKELSENDLGNKPLRQKEKQAYAAILELAGFVGNVRRAQPGCGHPSAGYQHARDVLQHKLQFPGRVRLERAIPAGQFGGRNRNA